MGMTLVKVEKTDRMNSEEQYKLLVERLETGDRIDPSNYRGEVIQRERNVEDGFLIEKTIMKINTELFSDRKEGEVGFTWCDMDTTFDWFDFIEKNRGEYPDLNFYLYKSEYYYYQDELIPGFCLGWVGKEGGFEMDGLLDDWYDIKGNDPNKKCNLSGLI
jgi:hypothetical protein